MAEIEWKIPEQMLSQELVSTDNRWHISKTQSGHADAEFFLTRACRRGVLSDQLRPAAESARDREGLQGVL